MDLATDIQIIEEKKYIILNFKYLKKIRKQLFSSKKTFDWKDLFGNVIGEVEWGIEAGT